MVISKFGKEELRELSTHTLVIGGLVGDTNKHYLVNQQIQITLEDSD
jgi:hypothetical protein